MDIEKLKHNIKENQELIKEFSDTCHYYFKKNNIRELANRFICSYDEIIRLEDQDDKIIVHFKHHFKVTVPVFIFEDNLLIKEMKMEELKNLNMLLNDYSQAITKTATRINNLKTEIEKLHGHR